MMSNRLAIIFQRLRRLSAAEDGFTIVFGLVLLTVGIAVGAAALADTLATRSHANLDTRQRRALQAADYGVQEVLYRVNQVNLDSLDLTGGKSLIGKLPVCVVHEGGKWTTKEPNSEGVCPKIVEEIGNHDSYQAEFIPNEKVPTGGSGISFIEPKIIAIGIDDNGNTADPNGKVYARVDAGLSTVEPFKTLEANHDLTFRVPLAEVFNGTARAAHQLFLKGETPLTHVLTGSNLSFGGKEVGPAKIEFGCGATAFAPGKEPTKPIYEKGLFGQNNVDVLPESMLVPLQESLEGEGKKPCEEPYFKRTPIIISGSRPDCSFSPKCVGLPGYKEVGDRVEITNGETLTLIPGYEYVLCSLWTNGPITLAAGASNASLPVRLFIDNPKSSRCNWKGAGEEKGTLGEEWTVENGAKEKFKVKRGGFYAGQGVGGLVGGFQQTLSPTQVQLYMAGSGTPNQTEFTSVSPAGNAFVLYAPQSNVSVEASTFGGTLIGYDTTVKATLYTQDLGLNNYPLTNSYGVFHVAGYTQCSPSLTEALKPFEGLSEKAATDLAGC
jgi:hypothetical protein